MRGFKATWQAELARYVDRQHRTRTGTAILGIAVLAVAALAGASIGSAAPVTGTVRPAKGPSAEQLAHGHWVAMPAAPFRLCDPVSAWDGQALVVVEPGVRASGWCPARAGGFLVIMIRGRQARSFLLEGNRWAPLPELPQPATGSVVAASAAVSHGSVYVLADVAHLAPPSGDIELPRLTVAGWARTPLSAGAPSSDFTLTTVAGGLLAAGSACPGKDSCTVDLEALAVLHPGGHPDIRPLHPRPGVPAPGSIAAGVAAVVVTNPDLAAAVSAQPPTNRCLIYDLRAKAWLRGPDLPTSRPGLGSYWTPDGVVSLGQTGLLLRPGRTVRQ